MRKASPLLLLVPIGLILIGGIFMISVLEKPQSAATSSPSPRAASTLSAHIESGTTTLAVRDLKLMRRFYEETIGLSVTQSDETTVTLARGGRDILQLVSTPNLSAAPLTEAGLYHNAILFASRSQLAQTLDHIFATEPQRFQGSSDHRVSEAFYFVDPEGNGLELYFDKDASIWQWENGRVVMGSSYIDPEWYIAQYGETSGDPTAKMGHVHLKVGDIAEAQEFYVDVLGMSIVAQTPGALFVSDGTYHHNIGLNVWESAGADPRGETLGLRSIELLVATPEDLTRLKDRLQKNAISFTQEDETVIVTDPWKNEIRILILEY